MNVSIGVLLKHMLHNSPCAKTVTMRVPHALDLSSRNVKDVIQVITWIMTHVRIVMLGVSSVTLG